MEHPLQRTRANVVRVDVTGVRVVAGRLCGKADDDEVFEDAPRIACLQWSQPLHRSARGCQPGAEIDLAVLAETWHRLTGAGVDGRQESTRDVEQAPVAPIRTAPVVEAARTDSAWMGPTPHFGATGGVECHERIRAGQHVHEAVGHQRIEEKRASTGWKGPRYLQPRDVGRCDLIERRELR